ncbi:hypothetical protein LDHU3_11.0670:CDS1 [Leishmania donovani]|nr:hypothetical protein LDHU3_11.0670:CDS1 [Leishmania donovani]
MMRGTKLSLVLVLAAQLIEMTLMMRSIHPCTGRRNHLPRHQCLVSLL